MNAGLIAALPFVLVPALLASGRVSALIAGVAGLLATVVALVLLRSADAATLTMLADEALAGSWLAVQAVAFILGGLFFYRCVRASEPQLFVVTARPSAVGETFDRRRLFAACFLLGPFAESATGFGVGMIIALPMILNAGARGLAALAFSLFSQTLVAWGSLGVGSAIGAELAGVPFADLAIRSAWLQAPVLLGHLLIFWLLLSGIGHRPTALQAIDDLVWTMLLAAALIASTTHVAPELGGLLAAGVLLVTRSLRDDPRLVAQAPRIFRSAWPYVVLTLILVATRMIPPLSAALQQLASLRPLPGEPAIAPLYHPATWLVATGLLALVVARRGDILRSALREVARAGWKPALVTIVYVVLARLVAGGGLAAVLAREVQALVGGSALYLAPLYGGLSGFLTGSNTASNGMMMPVQAALARTAGVDVIWIAAVQNIAGSTLTMLSPIRIATACALLGLVGQDRAAYARTWPVGAAALTILMVFWAALV